MCGIEDMLQYFKHAQLYITVDMASVDQTYFITFLLLNSWQKNNNNLNKKSSKSKVHNQ